MARAQRSAGVRPSHVPFLGRRAHMAYSSKVGGRKLRRILQTLVAGAHSHRRDREGTRCRLAVGEDLLGRLETDETLLNASRSISGSSIPTSGITAFFHTAC